MPCKGFPSSKNKKIIKSLSALEKEQTDNAGPAQKGIVRAASSARGSGGGPVHERRCSLAPVSLSCLELPQAKLFCLRELVAFLAQKLGEPCFFCCVLFCG